MNKYNAIVLPKRNKTITAKLIMAILAILFFAFAVLFGSNFVKSASVDPDFEVRVAEMLELRVSTCNSSDNSQVVVDIEPSVGGTFRANCQDVLINTNNPGYYLTVKTTAANPNYNSGTVTNDMLYITPSTITPTPAIAVTSNTIASPNTLSDDTWGFAVEGLNSTDTPTNQAGTNPNFNSTYTLDNASNTYANLPITNTTIYSTSVFPIPVTSHRFYYAARITPSTMAGSYATTVTYTAVGNAVPPAPKTCKNAGTAPECIEFTVDVGSTGTYAIPTSGTVAGIDHTYDWDVYVDGYLTSDCTNGNCIGTSSIISSGISLTSLTNGQHQILIVPNDEASPGWGNAFGYYATNNDANATINKEKLITIDSPLTTMAFAPKTTESTTSASNMFSFMFYDCSNLTTTAIIIDTYRLPDTITDLSFFLNALHNGNVSLSAPIDLSTLSGWLNKNKTIASLRYFLSATHSRNTNLTDPIDLTPLSDWFEDDHIINTVYGFMIYTHSGNSNLTLTGQKIFPSWVKTITDSNGAQIWDANDGATVASTFSFYQTFYLSSTKTGDTGEVRFEDDTVLSSVGQPRYNHQTYTNRTGITPTYNNWK